MAFGGKTRPGNSLKLQEDGLEEKGKMKDFKKHETSFCSSRIWKRGAWYFHHA